MNRKHGTQRSDLKKYMDKNSRKPLTERYSNFQLLLYLSREMDIDVRPADPVCPRNRQQHPTRGTSLRGFRRAYKINVVNVILALSRPSDSTSSCLACCSVCSSDVASGPSLAGPASV